MINRFELVECTSDQLYGAYFVSIPEARSSGATDIPVPVFFATPTNFVGAYYVGREDVRKSPMFVVNHGDVHRLTEQGPVWLVSNGRVFSDLRFARLTDSASYLERLLLTEQVGVLLDQLLPIGEMSVAAPAMSVTLTPNTLSMSIDAVEEESVVASVVLTNSVTAPSMPGTFIALDVDGDPTTPETNAVSLDATVYANMVADKLSVIGWRYLSLSPTYTGTALTGFEYEIEFTVRNSAAPTGGVFALPVEWYVANYDMSATASGSDTVTITVS